MEYQSKDLNWLHLKWMMVGENVAIHFAVHGIAVRKCREKLKHHIAQCLFIKVYSKKINWFNSSLPVSTKSTMKNKMTMTKKSPGINRRKHYYFWSIHYNHHYFCLLADYRTTRSTTTIFILMFLPTYLYISKYLSISDHFYCYFLKLISFLIQFQHFYASCN